MLKPFLLSRKRLALSWIMSSICALALVIVSGSNASAHEVQPAVGDVTVNANEVLLRLEVTLEPLIAGIDLASITDTNDSPLSGLYDQLRAQSPDDLANSLQDAWPRIQNTFKFEVDGAQLTPEFVDVRIMPVGNVELPRESVLFLRADLPEGTAPVTIGWQAQNGPLVLRQFGEDRTEMYSGYLTGGAVTDPLPRVGVAQVSPMQSFVRYVILGFEHIIPKGLDHILFVLALFFFSRQLGPLLVQISAFTLAHTLTLALASLNIVSLPGSIVEPLIAASIVYAAIENIMGGKIGWRRTVLVFAFGLLHGLGFAGVLGEIGLDPNQFILSLIAFNVGVEIGQLAVIVLALFGLLFITRVGNMGDFPSEERPALQAPVLFRATSLYASLIIAVIGVWWVIERTLL